MAYQDSIKKELSSTEVNEIQDAAANLVRRYSRGEIWDSTRKSIEEDPVNEARKLQKIFNCGDIMHNRAKCGTCNEVIESTNRHDFVTCKCKSVSVDGGTWYLRRSFSGSQEGYDDMSENWPWVKYLGLEQ